MPKSRSVRPANRPSRRHEILASAIELLALQPPDEIAVSDIAAHCGMTPAAFYYHFTSKDEILDEIAAGFADEWSATVSAALNELQVDDLEGFVGSVLDWVEENELAARVFFVTSVGATSSCEAVRKRTRNDLARKAARAIRRVAPDQDKVRSAISGLALVTLLEVVSRTRLELDPSYRTLGPLRFRATAVQLATSLVGTA